MQFQRCDIVAAGVATVDDRDRQAELGCSFDESQAGHDGQRGSRYQQRLGVVDHLVRRGDTFARDAFAEVDDIRFEQAAAAFAVGHPEVRRVLDHRVGIRCDLHTCCGGDRFGESGIELVESVGQGMARNPVVARQAAHLGIGAVQIDDVA